MIIAVASGKGGTGKTLVATSLALSLKDRHRLQLLDCDVEEPNDHLFLRPVIEKKEAVSIPVPEVDEAKCTHCGKCADICAYNALAVLPKNVLILSNLCHGCGACSYLCPEKAITEKDMEIGVIESGKADRIAFVQGRLNTGEAMATPVIRKVKEKTNRDNTVIIDVSPGTSCPVVESLKDSDFCLLVTEPTPFGLNDLVLAVETVKTLGIGCGVVVNRANGDPGKLEKYCNEENIPILMTIPLDSEIARLYSRGITLAEGMPQWQEKFRKLFKQVQELVDERTGSLKR